MGAWQAIRRPGPRGFHPILEGQFVASIVLLLRWQVAKLGSALYLGLARGVGLFKHAHLGFETGTELRQGCCTSRSACLSGCSARSGSKATMSYYFAVLCRQLGSSPRSTARGVVHAPSLSFVQPRVSGLGSGGMESGRMSISPSLFCGVRISSSLFELPTSRSPYRMQIILVAKTLWLIMYT